MLRKFNSDRNGSDYDLAIISAVWQKGQLVPGHPEFRRDPCGALMQWSKYGRTEMYGWEIDHVFPVALGGSDQLSNLQPLQWSNNRHKADNYPGVCKVYA